MGQSVAANPKHIRAVIALLGLDDAKPSKRPSVKRTLTTESLIELENEKTCVLLCSVAVCNVTVPFSCSGRCVRSFRTPDSGHPLWSTLRLPACLLNPPPLEICGCGSRVTLSPPRVDYDHLCLPSLRSERAGKSWKWNAHQRVSFTRETLCRPSLPTRIRWARAQAKPELKECTASDPTRSWPRPQLPATVGTCTQTWIKQTSCQHGTGHPLARVWPSPAPNHKVQLQKKTHSPGLPAVWSTLTFPRCHTTHSEHHCQVLLPQKGIESRAPLPSTAETNKQVQTQETPQKKTCNSRPQPKGSFSQREKGLQPGATESISDSVTHAAAWLWSGQLPSPASHHTDIVQTGSVHAHGHSNKQTVLDVTQRRPPQLHTIAYFPLWKLQEQIRNREDVVTVACSPCLRRPQLVSPEKDRGEEERKPTQARGVATSAAAHELDGWSFCSCQVAFGLCCVRGENSDAPYHVHDHVMEILMKTTIS